MTPSEQNAAARAWAETDPAGAQQAICSAGSLRALRRAYVALRRKQPEPNAGRRRVREVIMVIRFAVRALARGSEFQPAGGELRIIELGWRGTSTLIVGGVAEHLAVVPVDAAGLSALALLHALQPQTVAPDVTQYPHAGILPASLAGAAVRVQVSDRFDERLPELPGPGVAADGDGWLPGFDPGPGPLAKLPALDFLHAGGLEAFQRGRGAPWPLRDRVRDANRRAGGGAKRRDCSPWNTRCAATATRRYRRCSTRPGG